MPPTPSLTQFVTEANRATSEAAAALRRRHVSLSSIGLAWRLLGGPVARFWIDYAGRGGWRGGIDGFIVCWLTAWLEFLTWAKWWAISLPSSRPASESVPAIPIQRSFVRPVDRATLSVVVLTKNEETRIGRCLRSIAWADELIVVDGQSTDRTVEICRAYGATVLVHPFERSFAIDRNLGLDHAQGDWVLHIDADDVVTAGFREAMLQMLHERPSHAAMAFWRQSVLLGRVMRHGGWHYRVPNLFRRGAARYEGLVHERPQLQGTIGELDGDIEHHPCEDLGTFTARQNRYTMLQAEDLLRLQRPTRRQVVYALCRRPWKIFWKGYVKKAGYRESWHGLVFAAFYAGVELLKWAQAWELIRDHTRSSTPERASSMAQASVSG